MTADIIPASELARRRAERERLRQEREALASSILGGLLDDEDDQPSAPASRAEHRKPTR